MPPNINVWGDSNVDNTEEIPTVISFCSGMCGIERGLKQAGVRHRVIAYVEVEAYNAALLVAKMESGELDKAPVYTDIASFPAHLFRGRTNLVVGGYPCTPFSVSGKRDGKESEAHLWPSFRRHIQSIRPDRCFLENVQGHITLGLSSVLSDLGEDGYRSTFGIFSAAETGAPHKRSRVFVMADSHSKGLERREKPRGFEKGREGEDEQPMRCSNNGRGDNWATEPKLPRVAYGCPNRVERIRLLGNGCVPATAARAWDVLEHKLYT